MKVITAPEPYIAERGDVFLFLAGGISNCWEWQDAVIKELEKYNLEKLVVFNPRRKNFPIDDPNAARDQIGWEFSWLNMADIFTMYFANADSDQPICMYELGRHLERIKNFSLYNDYYFDPKDRIVIGVEDGYRRAQDVYIQSELALEDDIVIRNCNPTKYAKQIVEKYNLFVGERS